MGNTGHPGRKEITRVRKQFACLKCGAESDTVHWIQKVGKTTEDSGYLHTGCWLSDGEPEQKWINNVKN